MSKECANCGNERIMLCPFCEHDFSERSRQRDAEIAALREAVQALGAVARLAKAYWPVHLCENHKVCELCKMDRALAAVLANPIARAAITTPHADTSSTSPSSPPPPSPPPR